jgi:nitronate monooxygenase
LAGPFVNPLLEKLRIRIPILQAPMAGVSTPALAAAVSNAGALGALGLGSSTASGARDLVRQTKALTDRPFQINFFCHAPATPDPLREARWLQWLAPQFGNLGATPPKALQEIYKSFVVDPAMLAMVLEERPAVVSFHFGLPQADWIRQLQDAGIVLLAAATNLEEAQRIADAGIDAIVAQGSEAGGHRGLFDPAAPDDELGTFALTRLLVTTMPLPVIAAGGIMDGAGIAAAMALGAQGAQLGTAFIACPETSIDEGYRRALTTNPRALRTTFTTSISGRKARSLENAFTALDRDPARPAVPDYPVAYDAGKALHAAGRKQGVFGYGAQWAGQAVPLIRSSDAASLVRDLEAERRAVIDRLAQPGS